MKTFQSLNFSVQCRSLLPVIIQKGKDLQSVHRTLQQNCSLKYWFEAEAQNKNDSLWSVFIWHWHNISWEWSAQLQESGANNLPAISFHSHSSKPIMKERNNGFKMYHKKSRYHHLSLQTTRLYHTSGRQIIAHKIDSGSRAMLTFWVLLLQQAYRQKSNW